MAAVGDYFYVISEGERGEGSTPIALTRTLKGAREYVHTRFGTVLTRQDGTNWMAPRSRDNHVDQIHVHRLRLGSP